MHRPLPIPSVEDWELIREISGRFAHLTLAELTPALLSEIERSDGVDAATALAFDRAWHHPVNRACIESVARWYDAPRQPLDACDAAFLVVPNGGYEVDPASQQMCEQLLEAARRHGFGTAIVPASSTSSLDSNANLVLNTLASRRERVLVVASISVGSAQFKLAIERSAGHEVWQRVRAWVNVCGLVDGTPVANLLLDNLNESDVAMYVRWFGNLGEATVRQMIEVSREAGRGADRILGKPLGLPEGIHLLNVVPFPLRRHVIYEHTRLFHDVLSQLGPNDGFGLIADMLQKPGELYPVWGADHYINLSTDVGRLADALLCHTWQRMQEGLGCQRHPTTAGPCMATDQFRNDKHVVA
ncbi:MAG TPA: hypothetical protein VFE62_04815 [Gemmataceae bacterium]|nr:hypothetical protein [Gemmataceae bacterium]